MNSARGIYYVMLAGLAAVGASISQYMGGWDGLTKLLVWVMGVDYLTGILCALIWHRSPKTETGGYESRAGFKGLIRKGAILLIVMIAAELDKMTSTNAIRTAVILFFAANDGMSILENLGIMGVPYPPALKNAFEVLRKKSEDKGSEDDTPQMSTVDTYYEPKHDASLPADPYADLKDGLDADFDFLDGMPDDDGGEDG